MALVGANWVEERLVRCRVVVHGRVQGVFFRAETAQQARARKLAGWVRNRAGGSVEAVFEGPADAVEALVEFCRTGPRWARVEQIEVHDETPQGLRSFEIRY